MPPPCPDLTPLDVFRGARDDPSPTARAKDLRARARALRDRLMAAPPVPSFESFDLVRVPYPSRYALLNAARVPTPFCHIMNRLFVIQAEVGGRRATLLVSPSDVEANRATPYFRRIADGLGALEPAVRPAFAPVQATVEQCLERAGVRPEDVDYITYDHLHTQDLRRWLGTHERPGLFPRARLLVTRQEWESAHGLLPVQAEWYCPGGVASVPPERVVVFEGDRMFGESVALVRTPGHTEGNHSIAVRTPEGVFVMSENGVGPDAFSPLASRIPGVARHARETGQEVVLNGNTLEGGLDQYLSMLVERELAGPSERHPDFTNNLSTSELTAWPLFPGMAPTFAFGPLRFGAYRAPPEGAR